MLGDALRHTGGPATHLVLDQVDVLLAGLQGLQMRFQLLELLSQSLVLLLGLVIVLSRLQLLSEGSVRSTRVNEANLLLVIVFDLQLVESVLLGLILLSQVFVLILQ